MKYFTSLLAILFVVISTSNAQHTLKYNFEPGQEILYSTTTMQNIKQEVQGNTQNITQTITSDINIRISEVNDGTARLTMTYGKLYMNMDMGMMQMEFDTEGEGNTPYNDLMKAMIGPEFYAEINERGEILSVDGIENLQQAVSDSAQSLNPQERTQIMASINQQFNADQLKSTLQQAFVYYPAGTVEIEETWENEISNPAFQSGVLHNIWQLDEINGDTASISVEGTVSMGGSAQMQDGMKAQINGDAKQKYTIDRQTGWPVNSSATITMEGVITMEGNAQMPDGMEVPMSIQSEQESTFTMQ